MKTIPKPIIALIVSFFFMMGLSLIENQPQVEAGDFPQTNDLFSEVETKSRVDYSTATIKAKTVAVNSDLLFPNSEKRSSGNKHPAQVISLNMFVDANLKAILDKTLDNESGSKTWVGEIAGEEGSSVIFVAREGRIFGSIDSPSAGTYSLRPVDDLSLIHI